MNVLAIDPGTEQSAYVVYDGAVLEYGILDNEDFAREVREWTNYLNHMAIEMVACYGMPVGAEVFETCVWIGKFESAWGDCDISRVYRKDVKLHLCGQPRAKDANIRQALIDKFGPGKERAIGRKATPGPLYGIKSHEWAALAVAVTWWETMR